RRSSNTFCITQPVDGRLPKNGPAKAAGVGLAADAASDTATPGTTKSRFMRMRSASTAEDAAQDAAHDLVAQLGADGARGLLGHRLDHALAALGAEHRVLHRLAEAACIRIVLLCLRGRRIRGLHRRLRTL